MCSAGIERPAEGAAAAPDAVEIDIGAMSPRELCGALRSAQSASVFFDCGPQDGGWAHGPLVAVRPRVLLTLGAAASRRRAAAALAALERAISRRAAAGGGAGTGIAVLLSYDLWDGPRGGDRLAGMPKLVAFGVDRSVRWDAVGRAWACSAVGAGDAETWAARLRESGHATAEPARIADAPRTSLPRAFYVAAVDRVKRLIADGEIYQANLCQRFSAAYRGDPFELHRALGATHRAARSAYVEGAGLAVASASPETFLRVAAGRIETHPIKGTRGRFATDAEDRAAAAELLRSEKDRAELVMIVDLERNDLSRISVGGSVRARAIELRTLPAVHHLVGAVEGRLRAGIGAAAILAATFPGGSITGAPKIRAMQVLREVEPVDRTFYTGSLVWFGDDGRLDSSILIRTAIFDGTQVAVGAGGGIVADSDADAEWAEANQKVRFLTTALGFEPEGAR